MKIRSALTHFQESATLRINNLALGKRAKGKTIYHFGFGQSPFPVPETMQQALRENADKKAYLPGLGLPELREDVARFLQQNFGYKLDAANIAIGPGSKELIFDLLFILEGTLLLPSPSWVSYAPMAKILNKPVVDIETEFSNNYKLTAEALKNAVASHKDAHYILILNSPSNPTGQCYSQQELQALARVCAEHKIAVVSDEIYSLLDFTRSQDLSRGKSPKHFTPSIQDYLPEQSFVTGGLSKAFCAGGWRLGFLSFPEQSFGDALQTLVSETFSCVSSPIQHAARRAFQMDQAIQDYIQDTSEILRLIGTYTYQRLVELSILCHPSQGGFYMFIDFANYKDKFTQLGIHTSSQVCDYLLTNYNIALLPGSDFGRNPQELSARLAFVDFDGEALLNAYRKDKQAFKHQLPEHISHMKNGLEALGRALVD